MTAASMACRVGIATRHVRLTSARFTGEQEGLWRVLRKVAVFVGLAHQPGAHDQHDLAQQLGDTVRLPPVVERDRVTERLRPV